jgi:hypothetical protein|tara:strand:+ start:35 stop:379 length:345 start_codon:yes stop_codon:yes gene_type:complete
MKGDTFIYVADTLSGTADDAGVFKGSDFMSAEIASATTVELRFKAGEGYGTKNGVVTLTVPTLEAGAGSVKFKEACKVIAGVLNNAKGKMLVLADDVNNVHVAPFTGVVVDDIN